MTKITAAWGNDTLFLPGLAGHSYPGDDDGFTNDFRLTVGGDAFSAQARHRMITERGGMRRVDELTLGGDYVDRTRLGRITLSLGAGGGATLLGPLGGAQVQDAVHQSPFAHGRLLGRGLQDRYEPELTVTPALDGFAAADSAPTAWLTLSARADARVAVVTSATIAASITARVPLVVSPFVTAGASGTWQTIFDPRLSIPGGYQSGCYVAPAIATGVSVGPVSVGLDMRWNEGGAGHGIGEAWLAVATER